MTLAEERKKYYLQRSLDNSNNISSGIPWGIIFPKIGSIIPVIPKGYQILWTAGSGIGKTQTWIGIVLYSVYKLKKEHPELKLNIKLVIALLEDTKEMFIDRLYSMIIYDKYKIKLDGFALQSLRGQSLDSKMNPILDDVQKEIEFLLEDCEIIDNIYNPTGLYKWCRSISNKYGEHKNKDKEFVHDDGKKTIESVYSHYELKDPNMQFLLIVDNLNNLAQEKQDMRVLSQLETINLWSRSYCRLQIAKHWKWSILNVIQQAADSEKQQFDIRGRTIVEKIKPSLDGLGNSKECQRDHFVIFGIFAPNRFGIQSYPEESGYDISSLGDKFRSLIVLKSNLSQTNVEIPLYFDGAVSNIKEMPASIEMTAEKYKRIKEL